MKEKNELNQKNLYLKEQSMGVASDREQQTIQDNQKLIIRNSELKRDIQNLQLKVKEAQNMNEKELEEQKKETELLQFKLKETINKHKKETEENQAKIDEMEKKMMKLQSKIDTMKKN